MSRVTTHRKNVLSDMLLAGILCWPVPSHATSLLGSAASFAVLGSSAVTNTGPSAITGDIGVSPGTAITGIETVLLTGSPHAGDAVVNLARADAVSAAATIAAMTSTVDLSGSDLGTVGVLTPGVYRFASTAQLTGTLTLDFAGHPDRPFVFQIGSALTTASASDMIVLGAGSNSGIFWNIGSSATFGAGSGVVGNFLAKVAITADAATRVTGRLFALNAAVTVDSASISNYCPDQPDRSRCNGRTDANSRGYGGLYSSAPEPAAWAMMILGFGATGVSIRRRQTNVSAN